MAYASEKTGAKCYEEVALATFGPRMQKFTCICMIPTNIGFILTYIVLVSTTSFKARSSLNFLTLSLSLSLFNSSNRLLHSPCN